LVLRSRSPPLVVLSRFMLAFAEEECLSFEFSAFILLVTFDVLLFEVNDKDAMGGGGGGCSCMV